MAPWHRTWAVGQISKQITGAIERASEANRELRGFGIDVSGEGDRQSVASWEDIGMDGTESSGEKRLIRMFETGLRQPKQWQAFWEERRKKFN